LLFCPGTAFSGSGRVRIAYDAALQTIPDVRGFFGFSRKTGLVKS
jgi:hypothetical protein